MSDFESSMHSSSDLPEIDKYEPSEGGDRGNETDGSYMSSSFYASDQGEDSEDESQPHGPSKVASPPLPPTQFQPANTLPGLPFLPLEEISSYLSLEDLASLYRTHRQLRSTIDEGSHSFFGRFWTYPPKSEWVNRARRAHGWHEPVVAEKEEEEQEAGAVGDGRRRERGSRNKMSEIGMDEFWKQIRSAFWVTSFPWDRNDRAMIQQSFWSNLLSPENSPPPEPSPSKFSSSSPPSPVPQSQTRILRPTLSAGYRAYAQHGYVLTGVHHLLILQRQVCWLCLFCPEEGSQGPEIKILRGGGRGRVGGLATTTTSAEDRGERVAVGVGVGVSSPSTKVCEGCGAATCGRHSTSSETSRSLAVELSFLPAPPPAHGHFLFHTLQSMRDVIVASSQGENPLQVYYRRRNASDENSDWVAAHFGAAQAQAALAAGFGGVVGGLGGGGGNGAAVAAGGGNVGAGGGGGGGLVVLGGPAPAPAGFGGVFIGGVGGGGFFGGGAGAGPFGAIGVGGANANANATHPFLPPPPPPPPPAPPIQNVFTIGNLPPLPPPPVPQLQPPQAQTQPQPQIIAQPNPFPVPVPIQPQPLPLGFHVAHNPYQHGGGGGAGERPVTKDWWVCAQCAKQFGGFGWSRRSNGAVGF